MDGREGLQKLIDVNRARAAQLVKLPPIRPVNTTLAAALRDANFDVVKRNQRIVQRIHKLLELPGIKKRPYLEYYMLTFNVSWNNDVTLELVMGLYLWYGSAQADDAEWAAARVWMNDNRRTILEGK